MLLFLVLLLVLLLLFRNKCRPLYCVIAIVIQLMKSNLLLLPRFFVVLFDVLARQLIETRGPNTEYWKRDASSMCLVFCRAVGEAIALARQRWN